jgi:hypothetical protein
MAAAAEEEALLAAAQAQAEEEEAISTRLPREVLNINRRLEQQQTLVDSIQGNIAKLTEMVTQLGVNLQRAHEQSPSESTVTESGNHHFHTPPPPPPHLSPITKKPTPPPSHNPPNRPQQPTQAVHFGQLTPNQLPHPQFPPSS